MFANAFSGKKVWLSGHTGFKGAWLAEWLLQAGAQVHGFALAPETSPSLFDQLNLANRLSHEIADINHCETVAESIAQFQPDFVFHLAAQPLVRRSYRLPLETYKTNVLGTIHVLEALRTFEHPCAAVIVTTDKCYENRENGLPYSEDDPLGGRDPYSSSKAMAEIAVAAYRQSYFQASLSPVKVATARAGNVVGGGDWAEDRIVPDCIRALQSNQAIVVRNPSATRPWQHVLEPLSGYLWLAASLSQQAEAPHTLNFGPNSESNRCVQDLVTEILKHWPGHWIDQSPQDGLHEAKLLNLSIDKAASTLGWRPVWNFEQTLQRTVEWYRRSLLNPSETLTLTRDQIESFCCDAKSAQLSWT